MLRRSTRSRKAVATIAEPHHDDDDDESMKESDEESVEDVKPRSKNPSPTKLPPRAKAPKPAPKARSKRKATKATSTTVTTRSTKSSFTGAIQKVLKHHPEDDTAIFPSLLRAVIATKSKDPASVLPSVIHEFWQSHSEADRLPALYQFLIHSIGGGSIASLNLLGAEQDWDDLTDDDWTDHFDAVVEAMSSQTDPVLLSTTSSSHTEYAKLYQAFWKQLVSYVLTKSHVSSEEDDDDDAPKNPSTTTFQIEWIRQLLSRFMELAHVGVPDVRFALCGAIYSTGTALLDYSRDTLRDKLAPAQRQRSSASQNQQKRKSAQLQQQIDGWKRTLKNIEDMAVNFIFTAVFTVRYKDHDPMIRALSLQALSQYCQSRPDLFLQSSYLKYFGWMLSDKVASVRVAALAGLRQAVATHAEAMTSVLNKFLPRLVECGVRDMDASVQEAAMELLWYLLRETDFFHDVDNEELWVQINRRALDPQTTAAVRKYALYFVWEQLDVPTVSKPEAISERDAMAQLQLIAQWIAHTLSDGCSANIPIAQLRYELVDYIVLSLRDMPEYRHLVCSQWNALLRGVRHGEDRPSSRSSQGRGRGEHRLEMVTQRVLIRMLATAVQLEAWSYAGKGEDGVVTDDVEFAAAHQAVWKESMPSRPRDTKKKASSTNTKSQEDMTLALLRELPRLLTSFKTEVSILQSLTCLPQYFLPSVWSLSSRTKEFEKLCSILSKLMNESTDPVVIGNSCRALAVFAKALLHPSDLAFHLLQEFWLAQTARLEDLLKAAIPEEDTDHEDLESSVHLCILRLSIIAKVWSVLNGDSADEILDQLSTSVTSYLVTELQSRQLVYHRDDETSSSSVQIPELWSSRDENVHSVVARSVSEGLDLLLALVAWRLKQEIQHIDKGQKEPDDIENHLVLRMRQRIEKIIGLCYEQYIPRDEMDDYSDAHQKFSIYVQEHGIRVSGDIRMLFPRKWSQAKSPFLKAVAIENDALLAGGAYRFVRSRELLLKDSKEDTPEVKSSKEQELMFQMLLPLARALGINWESGSRKEAGAAFVHLIGSGKDASEMVLCMSRVLKKMSPVRLLEAQMACLRQHFETWAEGEPEEPGDRPTEEEMQQFEEQERVHQKEFEVLVQMGAKLSAALGVGKIRDKILNPALLGFVREGIRFAFSTNVIGSDEPLPVGCRLPFLTILQKYLIWIRSNKDFKNIIMNDLNRNETELRNHPEFGEVFEEDLKALQDFRKAGELGEYPLDEDGDTFVTNKVSGSKNVSTKGLKPRTSMGSSVSSIHSKASASLNSIQEEDALESDEDNESHEIPSPQKRPRLSSSRTQASAASSRGPSLGDFTDGGSDTDGSSSM